MSEKQRLLVRVGLSICLGDRLLLLHLLDFAPTALMSLIFGDTRGLNHHVDNRLGRVRLHSIGNLLSRLLAVALSLTFRYGKDRSRILDILNHVFIVD